MARVVLVDDWESVYVAAAQVPLTNLARDLLRDAKRHASTIPGPPGGLPGLRTGHFSDSMSAEIDEHGNIVISNSASYARFLMLGTSRMAPRPSMQLALYRWRGDYE